MALETTFRELVGRLRILKETLDALRCLLPDDPLNLEVALVQHLRESVDNLAGWLEDCLDQALTLRAELGPVADLERSRRTLTLCQASFDEAEHTFSTELFCYERLREVLSLGARRKGIWLIWSQNVKRDIDVCRYKLDLTRKALTACWQELAEHAGKTNISVQATNVGQQFVTRRSALDEREVEGVT
jgi:hypothetical protein